MGGRGDVRGRLPADAAHVGAPARAAGALVVLDVGLERRGRRAVAGRVRSGPHAGVGRRRRRRRAGRVEIAAQVHRQRAVVHEVEVALAVVQARGHGQVALRRGWRREGRAVCGISVGSVGTRAVLSGSTRCQSRSRGSSRLLDGSRVVVLVTSERCPSRERLLAICKWAFVGTLARVDASVPRERAGVAEGLQLPS